MRYNDQWVFRNIHGYNILINTLDNSILSISPVVAVIFESIKSKDDDLKTILLSWQNKNNIDKEKQIATIIEYFLRKGVFINE